jgi:hypothetical protein
MNQGKATPSTLVHRSAKAAQAIFRRGEFLRFVGQLLDQHAAAQAQPVPAPPTPPLLAHVDIEKTERDGEPEKVTHGGDDVRAGPVAATTITPSSLTCRRRKCG